MTTKAKHSKKQPMEPFEIIKKTSKNMGFKISPEQVYGALLKMVEQPKYRILRSGDTLLVIENMGEGNANGTYFIADPVEDIPKNLDSFLKGLKVAKFKTLAFPIPNLKFIEYIKRVTPAYQVKQYGQNNFVVTVTL
jgi:hypothetical protein